jgi:hypothetical protein
MTGNKRRSAIALALTMAAFAFCAVSASGASAAQFRWSATGEIAGPQTSNHVFTTGKSSLTCHEAWTSGEIESQSYEELKNLRIEYSKCAYLGAAAKVSPAAFTLHADGRFDLTNTITVSTLFGCTITIPPQTGLKSVSYVNRGEPFKLEASYALTGMTYNGSAGVCGSGTDGTYTGTSLIERVGGGAIWWEAI